MVKIIVVGSFIIDLAISTPKYPRDGETVIGNSLKIGPGGKGSNQATAARKAGAEVVMVTKIGRDFLSGIARDHYSSLGMTQKYVYEDPEHSTGAASIEVHAGTGENRIIIMKGANDYITEEDVMKAEDEFKDCDAVLLQLETSFIATKTAVKLAKKYGKKVILNTAPLQPIDESIFADCDFITPNETEAEFFSGVTVTDIDSARKAADVLLKKGAKNVIITLGKKGVYVKTDELDMIVPPYKVKRVDTTGAGDAFNGGFTVGLAEGMDVLSAIKFANALASISVSRFGTSPAMPTREEIEDMLAHG
ncbi:MAG: ribokinase, partial [Clostridia bacterium]|nr:ribokinase [Clostridia bacterium]